MEKQNKFDFETLSTIFIGFVLGAGTGFLMTAPMQDDLEKARKEIAEIHEGYVVREAFEACETDKKKLIEEMYGAFD